MTAISFYLNDYQQNFYYAGQVVSGNVRLETAEQIKIRGIRLEVNGAAVVQWIQGAGKNRQTYNGQEVYINFRAYLMGSDNAQSEIMLTPGVHSFPISFLLPNTAPSSFEGQDGSIRYRVRVVVDRPWKTDDASEILINVVRWLDLNNEPQLRAPIAIRDENPVVGCCYHFCCIKGLPELELRINKGGFVPGETMIISGHVVNKSSATIEKTVINFIQEIHYTGTSYFGTFGSKQQCNILGSIERPQVESGVTDTWSNIAFTVPVVMASRLDGCNIININYYVQVKANFSRGYADSTLRQYIVIGHMPLQGDLQYGGPIATQPPSTYPSSYQSGAPYTDQSNYPAVQSAGLDPNYITPSVELK